MKLNELIKNLTAVKEKYGGEIDAIYASDDEGNSFHDIYASPIVAIRSTEADYMTYEDLEIDKAEETPEKINAVIIN